MAIECVLTEREAPMDPQRRRGPLRPNQLLSVRVRNSRRLGAHTFRAVDVVAVAGITILTLHGRSPQPLLDTTVGTALPLIVGALALGSLVRSLDLYRLGRNERLVAHLGRTCASTVIAFGFSLVVGWIVGNDELSTQVFVAWGAMCGVGLCTLHLAWWSFVRRWRSQGWLTPNIVIVGATSHAEDLIQDAIGRGDMHVLGIFDDRLERSPLAMLGVPVLGDTSALVSHKIIPFVDLIVVTVDPSASARIRQITSSLSVLPNQVTLIFDHEGEGNRAAVIDRLADAPLASLNGAVDDDRRAFAKRLQDLVIGVPLLLALSPILALIAIAVRLDSTGPIVFRQRRHGFNNEEIVVWKFRTMHHRFEDANAARQVTANDDRITRVGRFLRRTSLDELPQLFNVLSGEMSLVGPRPHAIGMKTGDIESARLVAEYAHRHRIKPGMTGWAAIKGSRGPLHAPAEVSRRVELDVSYIDQQSLWLDLRIMALTIPGMLGDRAAVR